MRNDALLWYNVPGWQKFGLAVPNWGISPRSQNSVIRDFVAITGRNLQAVMFGVDAQLRTAPTINTLRDIHKLIIRARNILGGRAVPASELNMQPQHALPAPEDHRLYPVPYFEVPNRYLKEYCGLILTALTESLQHTENARPLEISVDFAANIGQYFHRVYRLMAVELFGVDAAVAKALNFTMTDEMLAAYNPSKVLTSTEMIDNVPDLDSWPTEIDLKPLTDGIPVSMLPALGGYPTAGRATAASGTAAASEPTAGAFLAPQN